MHKDLSSELLKTLKTKLAHGTVQKWIAFALPQLTARCPELRAWLTATQSAFLIARHDSAQLASDDEYFSRQLIACLDTNSVAVDNLTSDLAEPHPPAPRRGLGY